MKRKFDQHFAPSTLLNITSINQIHYFSIRKLPNCPHKFEWTKYSPRDPVLRFVYYLILLINKFILKPQFYNFIKHPCLGTYQVESTSNSKQYYSCRSIRRLSPFLGLYGLGVDDVCQYMCRLSLLWPVISTAEASPLC